MILLDLPELFLKGRKRRPSLVRDKNRPRVIIRFAGAILLFLRSSTRSGRQRQ